MTASRAARSPGDGSFPPGIFGAFPSSALPVQRQRMMEGGWADAAPQRDPNGDPNYFLAVCAPPPPPTPPPQAACATLCHIRCLGLPVPRPPQARVPCGAGTSPKSNSLLLSPGLFSSLLGHVGPPPPPPVPPPPLPLASASFPRSAGAVSSLPISSPSVSSGDTDGDPVLVLSLLLPPPPQCRHTIALNHPKPPVGFPLCCGGAEWDRPQCKGCIGGVGGGGGGALPCDIASTPSSKRAPFPHVDPNLKEGAEGGGEALQTGESCSFWVGIACLGLFGVYWWEGSDVGSPHLLVPWGDPQPPHELILSFSLCVPTVKKAKFDGPQGEWASGGWGGGGQRDPKLILLGDITRIVWGGGERDRGSLGRTMGGHSRGGVGGGTGWSLHPLLCSRREVQHLCDAEGAECQKYHHRSAGQPACLGAGLHVVSAPTPTGTPAPLFPVPHRDLMLLLASSTCGLRDPPTPLLPSSSGSPHPCFYL